MPFAIKPGQTVLFTGDSITDCGRRAHAAPLGEGYVRSVNDLIAAKYPAHGLKVINTGISGNTVRDLFNRWTDDVIRHQPDWLSIKIGINDVHRWLHQVQGASVSAEEFADLYEKILARVKKETKAQVVLVDPFYISTDTSSGSFRTLVLQTLPSYQKTVAAMAKKYKTRHVKLHDMFQTQLQHTAPDRWCPEPVHPNPSGHLLMAHEWLKSVGW
jgi:acyl-CoA thioesterase I